MKSDLRVLIDEEAAASGFDGVGVTSVDAVAVAAERLGIYLAAGYHGDMTWMAEHAARRRDPRALWPAARTAILLTKSYAPEVNPIATKQPSRLGVISAYARGRDYHDIVKSGLKRVARALHSRSGEAVKVFVDTAPLMEKPLAVAAGLGWQGKHTNLVSRKDGSWTFLGAILTTAELAPDKPEVDRCGSCTRCLDACPTGAFPAPYQLDARRCIAYLTIEHQGPIDEQFRQAIGNRVFGCDDCLAVCPWNKFAATARDHRLHARLETENPPLAKFLDLDDAGFRQQFAGTPVKRTGRDRVVRNALIAAGNSGDLQLVPQVERLLGDDAPLVRGMAIWALGQLAPSRVRDHAARATTETDLHVREEWARALTYTVRRNS